MKTVGFVCGEETQGGTLSRPPQTCCPVPLKLLVYIFSRDLKASQNLMSTRPGPRFNLNVGCGAPVSPSGLVPQTPRSQCACMPARFQGSMQPGLRQAQSCLVAAMLRSSSTKTSLIKVVCFWFCALLCLLFLAMHLLLDAYRFCPSFVQYAPSCVGLPFAC